MAKRDSTPPKVLGQRRGREKVAVDDEEGAGDADVVASRKSEDVFNDKSSFLADDDHDPLKPSTRRRCLVVTCVALVSGFLGAVLGAAVTKAMLVESGSQPVCRNDTATALVSLSTSLPPVTSHTTAPLQVAGPRPNLGDLVKVMGGRFDGFEGIINEDDGSEDMPYQIEGTGKAWYRASELKILARNPCPNAVLVAGVPPPHEGKNGVYTKIGWNTHENSARVIFKKKGGNFLYFWGTYGHSHWRIGYFPEAGQDGSHDVVRSKEGEITTCPTNASMWYYWDSKWILSRSLKVDAAGNR